MGEHSEKQSRRACCRSITVPGWLAGCGGTAEAESAPTPTPAKTQSKLEIAAVQCRLSSAKGVTLMDENKSLELHTPGKDYGQSYGISIEKVDCVLQDIGATMATMSKMKKTRALDGTQSASWDAIEATWSYHPDNGFDIILEEKTP